MSKLLSFTVDASGHLRVASGGSRCIVLRFLREGAEAAYADGPLVLPWDAYEVGRPGVDGATEGWRIVPFGAGSGIPLQRDAFGVAIVLHGHLRSAGHEAWRTTMPWWRRALKWDDGFGTSADPLLVLLPSYSVFTRATRGRVVLDALARVLHDRPPIRAALDSPERMPRLAGALAGALPRQREPRTGVRRDHVDIEVARIAAGFVHRYGRPLPGDPMPALDDEVAEVRRRLAQNPYRHDRDPVDDAVIAAWLRRNYFDVEPWPFGALLT
jgi:hypothetical protein